ncbi:histidine phosphatase family protein [Mycobacterium shimoidei]|uniref:histidine phosphatase family protein n=1 Tax=Mycobacterium shimoidei TaxID=29313 RepID=UPI0008495256|nr:histidine phosphatase family protein [Mycobacterium shimoidei]MCV7259453.1 histidine phosphatase family protein [Mycobacterium shimoidei]ODR14675.1 hypothetical protein BHQ16_04360 [Mycobacterium shimoidei]ORW81039.1 hypothetical protein AWC26_09260 [Mycobacterium shimoidei]
MSRRFRCLAAALSSALLFIAPAVAWADDPITLDFVRHGESGEMDVINNEIPGPGLTPTGVEQADAVADALGQDGIDQIFASTMIRSQETAQPLAETLDMWPLPSDHILAGLNEIDAGIYAGIPVYVGDLPLGGALYLLAPALWTLGLYFVPQLGSSDFNGMAFQDRVNDAIQTIYDESVPTGETGVTNAVFSHEGTIAIWALMNVRNPDFGLVLNELFTKGELLPYTGIVEVTGNPDDGWTLVSWDGQPVAQDMGLLTNLFVDLRDFITAPQLAAYSIEQAVLTGDPTEVFTAIQSGISEIAAATVQFPVAVFDDIIASL